VPKRDCQIADFLQAMPGFASLPSLDWHQTPHKNDYKGAPALHEENVNSNAGLRRYE
jgi:hypothetical protein